MPSVVLGLTPLDGENVERVYVHSQSYPGSFTATGPSIHIAIMYGYTSSAMDLSIAEAKNRLPELIRAVEGGEEVIITRHGKPVAQIAPPPAERRTPRLGVMKDRIKFLAGWDDSIDVDRFLAGDL